MNNSQTRSARYRNRRRNLVNTRRLASETLENRVLLAGDTSMAWHNADMPLDTNENGTISPSDLLTVVRDLNDQGARALDGSLDPIGMVDVNGDGFSSPADAQKVLQYLNAASGEDHELVRMRLEVTARDSLEPLTSLSPNQDFFLRVYTTDLTDNPEGLFSVYLDVEYNAELADADGTIEYAPEFDDGASGDLNVDGELDEIGAFTQDRPADGAAEQLVMSVPMRTDSNVGILDFAGNPSDNLPIHEVLVQGSLEPIPNDEILFEDVSIPITNGTTAINDEYVGLEDTELVVTVASGVLANDLPSTGLTATVVTGPTNGSLTLNADGSFSYTPNAEFSGEDSFTYVASDGVDTSNEATVVLDVGVVLDAPVAVDDEYMTFEDVPLDRTGVGQSILENDFDVDSPTLTVVTNEILGPDNGQLSMAANGEFTYTPNAGFTGTDVFTYIITDGVNVSNRATVTIVVEGEVDPNTPTANPDTYEAAQDQLLIIGEPGVLENDSDPNDATLRAQLVSTTSNGTLTLNPNGSFEYQPDPGFNGTDSFQYLAMNVALVSPTTTVTIEVTRATNLPPIANNDSYETPEDVELVIPVATGLLSNDTDPNGDLLTATLVSQPQNGSITLAADGSFVYTPDADFSGVDNFLYEASDGTLTDQGSVSITVTPVQDPPAAVDDQYDVFTDTTKTVIAADGVLNNDSDPDGDLLTVVVVDQPTNGVLTLNADGSFAYTPNAEFIGTDAFTYSVTDGNESRIATVSLSVEPEPMGPFVNIRLAATDSAGIPITSIEAGEEFLLNLFVTDTSPDPQDGIFAAYADIEWDPNFAFVVGDLTYDVNYPNGQRGATGTSGLVDEAGAFSREDVGSGQEVLLLTVPMQAAGDGVVTFTTNSADDLPFGNVLLFDTLDVAVPIDRITYGSTSLTVFGPTAPSAVADRYELDDTSLTVTAAQGVLANDLSFEGQPLSATVVSTTSNGVLDLNSDGSFTYTPAAGFFGEDTFTYQVTESGQVSNVATVTIEAGIVEPSSLSGSVYFDTNNNGVRETSEHGFGGLTVTLIGTDSFGNNVAQATTTTSSGAYSFLDLAAGDYTIREEKPEIVIDGKDTINGVESTTNDSLVVTLGANENLTGLNFGERGLMPQFILNSLFMSSRITDGAAMAIGPDGSTSWYCSDSSWSDVTQLTASLSSDGTTVNIRGVNSTGQSVGGSFTTANPNIRVIGNATTGFLVRLMGSSSSFPLSSFEVAAVDAVFGS